MGILEAVRQGRPVPVPVIDAHTHPGQYSLGGNHPDAVHVSAAVAAMDRCGVAAIVASPGPLTFGDMALTNDLCLQMMQAHPGRIYGNLFLAPHLGAKAVAQAAEEYAPKGDFVGIKLMAGPHGEADRPEYAPAWEFARKMNCPVSLHLGKASPSCTGVLRVLDKYPDVKIILSHQGGNLAALRQYILRKDDCRIYFDTSGTMLLPFPELVEACGEDRLICGSDYVLHDFSEEVGKIVFSGLPEEVMKMILAENYLRLLEDSRLAKIRL